MCDKRFARKENLKSHVKIKHSSFVCPNCSKSYGQRFRLNEHIKRKQFRMNYHFQFDFKVHSVTLNGGLSNPSYLENLLFLFSRDSFLEYFLYFRTKLILANFIIVFTRFNWLIIAYSISVFFKFHLCKLKLPHS